MTSFWTKVSLSSGESRFSTGMRATFRSSKTVKFTRARKCSPGNHVNRKTGEVRLHTCSKSNKSNVSSSAQFIVTDVPEDIGPNI